MNNKKTKYKVEYRPLESLKPLENNPRYIKEEDFERLCASVQNNPELFEAQPIILSDRTGELVIIAGNQRYRAAKEVGLKEVPTVLLAGLTEQKEKEIIIRTNVTNGKWDYDRLANDDWSIKDLGDWGLDCSFLNTDEDDTDIDKLFEDAQNTESKVKDIKLTVHIPQKLEEKLEEIKEAIKVAVSEYEGVELK